MEFQAPSGNWRGLEFVYTYSIGIIKQTKGAINGNNSI